MRQMGPFVNRRCERHGLVFFNDGACLLCDAEQRHRKRRRLGALALVSFVALGVFATIAVRIPATGRFRAAVPNKDDDSLRQDANRWMNFWATSARNTRVTKDLATTAGSTSDPVARSYANAAEDWALGKPTQAPPASIAAPPAPPRAPVDPEPESPDSPADFELPR